ncbi:cupin domain-containing protein [Shinella oryzae]|uniref:Cupin domain-containing protein n=1 Tax=Shinella oryzae TaxID=2871820 RepID=A0ABY9KA81_9HYPH|nr:cupin domain-containing protein [Shinella oryzae]WLS04953.1 cupin domain-containing protein [Shinella oryzae]
MSDETVFKAPGFVGRIVRSLGEMEVIDVTVDGDMPAHAAESDDFFVVLSGRFEVDVEGAINVCAAGDYMMVAKGSSHAIRMLEPGRLILIGKV